MTFRSNEMTTPYRSILPRGPDSQLLLGSRRWWDGREQVERLYENQELRPPGGWLWKSCSYNTERELLDVEEKCKAEASSNSIQIQVGLFNSICPEFQVVSLRFRNDMQDNRCTQFHFTRTKLK
jgi:hypothetical protein